MDDSDSVENLVADLAVDGQKIRELSFREIKELERHWKGWARDLLGMGLDDEGTRRLLLLAQEYGFVRRAGIVDVDQPDGMDDLHRLGEPESVRFDRFRPRTPSGRNRAGQVQAEADYKGALGGGTPKEPLRVPGVVH